MDAAQNFLLEHVGESAVKLGAFINDVVMELVRRGTPPPPPPALPFAQPVPTLGPALVLTGKAMCNAAGFQ